MNKSRLLLLLWTMVNVSLLWGVDQSYYSSINNKQGKTLRDNLCERTYFDPQNMSYDGLWDAYYTSDVYPADSADKAGKIWDMYSNVLWTPGEKQCGNYKNVGSCYNREHSVPKSWFNESKPAYYDMGHLVPTDGYVNNQRGNEIYGECENGTRLKNGSYVAKGKLGASTFSGYTQYDKVFEPDDEFKGDFARMHMYMRVRYKDMDMTSGNGSKMFNKTDANYGMTAYAIALLMKWHRIDPVSQKEIDRNNAMEKEQGNRNPFIDYPILAEYLWGEKTNETFTLANAIGSFEPGFIPGVSDGSNNTLPRLISPTGTIGIGSTEPATPISKVVSVKGANLESGDLSLAISGTDASFFTLSVSSISQTEAENGYDVTVTYTPTANGNHSAILTISGCGITSYTVTLTGNCTAIYTVTWIDATNTQITKAAVGTEAPLPSNTPDDCSAQRVFVGWSADANYSGDGSDLFTFEAPTITKDSTFYAVYANQEGEGNPAAEEGTILWAESFTGFKKGDVPNKSNSSTTVYDGGAVTYSVTDGKGTTQIYNEKLAGGTAPELLIAKSDGSFSIANIPTGGAEAMKLTFKTNRASGITITSSTKGIEVGTVSISSGEVSCEISNTDAAETFNLTITNSISDNSREDDFLLVVKTAGNGGISYSHFSLDCSSGPATSIDGNRTDHSSHADVRKILINSHIFIIRNDKIYTIQGELVH